MLTDSEIERIAKRVVELLCSQQAADHDLLTTEEAARLLKVTPQTMRRNKDNYPHIKYGDNEQGQLRFLKSGIVKALGLQ